MTPDISGVALTVALMLATDLLHSETAYVKGANVVAHCLRKHGSKRDFAVIVTSSVSQQSRDKLSKYYKHVLPVSTITNQDTSAAKATNRADLADTFTKFALWKQTQFDKIVYLDADTLPLRAPEELFELTSSFAAAPELGLPDCFNSGVMVLTPSEDTFAALTRVAEAGASFDGGDQGVLNAYFGGMDANENTRDLPLGPKFERLSFMYNIEVNQVYRLWMPALKEKRKAGTASVVHFIGAKKAWDVEPEKAAVDDSAYSQLYAEFVRLWWDAYREVEAA